MCCAGTVTLKIVDQSEDCSEPGAGAARQHLVENLDANRPGLAAFQRPTSARNHRGFGFVEFAPLSIFSDQRYVRNDRLIIHARATEANLAPRD